MAFGPVNTGGGTSGGTMEAINASIKAVQQEAAAAMTAHTGASNPHRLTAVDVGAVPDSRTVNGKPLTGDITLGAADVSAVPASRKVNGKALTEDINLTAEDVSAVPTARKVNGKALTGDITLTAQDVGAASANHSHADMSVTVFHAGPSAPANTGLLWIDTTATTGGLKYHNGTAWVHVPVSTT